MTVTGGSRICALWALSLVAIALLATAPPLLAQGTAPVSIIVNEANPLDTMERSDVIRAFLGQTALWQDETRVRPVDQSMASRVRKEFSEHILGQSLLGVKSYWQQQVFSGRAVPPPVKETEAEVLAFVAGTAGAIGYVSANVELPPSVKTVELLE